MQRTKYFARLKRKKRSSRNTRYITKPHNPLKNKNHGKIQILLERSSRASRAHGKIMSRETKELGRFLVSLFLLAKGLCARFASISFFTSKLSSYLRSRGAVPQAEARLFYSKRRFGGGMRVFSVTQPPELFALHYF